MRRAVFLDRDGVLNRIAWLAGVPQSPRTVADFEILPGVSKACRLLSAAGFLLIVVTNQPEIARGSLASTQMRAMHDRLRRNLPDLHDIRICPHDDADGCVCRKPRPGMLLDAARDWKLDLSASFMIGDRDKDLLAGRQAGCRVILVGNHPGTVAPDFSASDLPAAADWILSVSPPLLVV